MGDRAFVGRFYPPVIASSRSDRPSRPLPLAPFPSPPFILRAPSPCPVVEIDPLPGYRHRGFALRSLGGNFRHFPAGVQRISAVRAVRLPPVSVILRSGNHMLRTSIPGVCRLGHGPTLSFRRIHLGACIPPGRASVRRSSDEDEMAARGGSRSRSGGGEHDLPARGHVLLGVRCSVPADAGEHFSGRHDFSFDTYGVVVGRKCMATVRLPGYAAARVRTGQPGIWEGEFSLPPAR